MSMDNWTMAQLRAECATLGITPGRSKAEPVTRIMEARAKAAHRAEVAERAAANIKRNARGSGVAERHAAELAEVHARIGGPVPRDGVPIMGAFAQAAIAEAPEPTTPEEEQAMAEYSAEMRRMDEIGEAAWIAEQFQAPEPPRMSRTARMLCDCTAICGSLARNPLVYGGDPQRHDYAIMGGWQQVLMMQGRALARGLVARRR